MLYLSSTSNHNYCASHCACYAVVLYLSSTSNHNQEWLSITIATVVLYLSSTSNHNPRATALRWLIGGVISFFYIKPQPTGDGIAMAYRLCYIFLLHQTTTIHLWQCQCPKLCYIFLLHQTTTYTSQQIAARTLCYIFLLHQTTTAC